MARAFAEITFTESVKAAQTLYGSRENNRGFELAEDPRNTLGAAEAEFIHARDSFYQATVGEKGWPYVQHRGGAAGFIKVLDERTLGYADFRGNRQYISVGNIHADERISLIFMDYANQRRLKIWGRAKVVHESENPSLIAQLENPNYRARIERALVIHVEAYEWNCPQHITPRFTEAEIKELIAPLVDENIQLKNRLAASGKKNPIYSMGNGELALVVSGIRQLTPRVRAIELRDPEGKPLPEFSAGAHIRIPIELDDGSSIFRHYSICSNPLRRDIYEIAVLREEEGKGGSKRLQDVIELGMTLHCDKPNNVFPLHSKHKSALFIAGGIGITPIKPMAQTLANSGIEFSLHYAGQSKREMPFLDRLQREYPTQLHVYEKDKQQRLNVHSLLAALDAATDIYVCGPARLIDAVYASASELGIDSARIHSERFSATPVKNDKPLQLTLAKSQQLIAVSETESILDAVENAGITAAFDCRTGICGACAVKVVEGEVEHRDSVLSDADKAEGFMCICVSRAKSDTLVLDI